MADKEQPVKEEPKQEEIITLELTREEVFQLHLCVVARHSVASLKLVNALDQKETQGATGLTNFLEALDKKVVSHLVPKDEAK